MTHNTTTSNESLKYVAYFDFIGFRNWIKTEGSAEVYEAVISMLSVAVQGSLPNSYVNPDRSVTRRRSRVRHVNFSDTIVFYTTDIAYLSLKELIYTCVNFMGLAPDIHMVRGAIAKGPFRVFPSDNIHIGEALIDAYDLAEEQDWIGLAVHHNMNDDPSTQRYIKEFPACLVRYDIPLRDGVHNNGYCINWLDKNVSGWSYSASKQLDLCLKMAIRSASNAPKEIVKIERRIQNTRIFLTAFSPERMT